MAKHSSCCRLYFQVDIFLTIVIDSLLFKLALFYPGKVTCRDINAGRIERLKRMLKSYIRQEDLERLVEIEFNAEKAGNVLQQDQFDKVLVDAPCTNDKKSLKDETNNMFAKKRIDERTELPSKQASLLK